MQLSTEPTMAATTAAKRCHSSRDILRARRACPGCGITMTYHALTYKHKCHGGPEAKRRRRMEQLDARIERRLGLAGGELEQQAGEHLQGEEEAAEEEAAPPEGDADEQA